MLTSSHAPCEGLGVRSQAERVPAVVTGELAVEPLGGDNGRGPQLAVGSGGSSHGAHVGTDSRASGVDTGASEAGSTDLGHHHSSHCKFYGKGRRKFVVVSDLLHYN